MRTFLKKIGLFAAIQAALLAAVLWSYNRQYPPQQNFLAASIDKHSLLSTQASPRLILIGGSSMAFGVNSEKIAAACGRRPVNMGLHAMLGLGYMLEEVKPYLRAEDWVIVAPEYQQFARLPGGSEFLFNLVEIDPRLARYLTRSQWGAIFDQGIQRRLGKEIRAVIDRPLRFFRTGTMGKTRLYYRRGGFNQNGDVVAHLTMQPPKIKEREFRLRHDEKTLQATIDALNDFADVAKARGARVFFSHPPLPAPLFEQNREDFARLEATLQKEVHIQQLDRAEDLAYPFDWFFDTWYHLARPGVEKRTEWLAAKMAEQAGGASKGALPKSHPSAAPTAQVQANALEIPRGN